MSDQNFDKCYNIKNQEVVENLVRVFATCEGIYNRAYGNTKIGDKVTVYASEERGMTHSGMPQWSEFCPKFFNNVDEAIKYAKVCGGVYNITLDISTIKVVEVIAEVTTTVNLYNRRETQVII